MNELLKCPRCQDDMIYDDRQEFWRCPKCGGEFWEDVGKLFELRKRETTRVVPGSFFFLPHTTTTVLPPVAVVVPGKGSRKSGRKWKKPAKQVRPWQVF